MLKKPRKRSLEKTVDDSIKEPVSKRARLSNTTNGTANNGLEHHKLTQEQINELPCLLNPNLYKAVFDSYRVTRKIRAPTKTSEIEPNKDVKCTLTINDGQKDITVCGTQSSKLKAEIESYKKLCHEYIPFQILRDLMMPYSSSISKGTSNIEQILQRAGEHLKDKTSTIVILNVPLNCNEMKILQLLTHCRIPDAKVIPKKMKKRHTDGKHNGTGTDAKGTAEKEEKEEKEEEEEEEEEDDANIEIRELVTFIYFASMDEELDNSLVIDPTTNEKKSGEKKKRQQQKQQGQEESGDEEEQSKRGAMVAKMGAISQRVFVQFANSALATHFVHEINGKVLDSHKLTADWAQQSFLSFDKLARESRHVMISGWPEQTSENQIKQYLQENHLSHGHVMINFRYSVTPYCVIAFKSHASASKEIKEWLRKETTDGQTPFYLHANPNRPLEKLVRVPLFVRFATEEETHVKRTIKSMFDAITRTSRCVKVSNVAWDVTEKDLTDILSPHGKVESIQLLPRKDFFCGYALVTYETENDAHNTILKINGLKLKGHSLQACFHVKQSKEDKKSIRQLQNIKEQELADDRKKEKQDKLRKKKAKNNKRRARKKKLHRR